MQHIHSGRDVMKEPVRLESSSMKGPCRSFAVHEFVFRPDLKVRGLVYTGPTRLKLQYGAAFSCEV